MMGVMAYNTNIVPPDKAPGGWQSCLDPQWKGKFSVDTKPNVLTSLVSAWGEEKLLDFAKRLKGNNPIFARGSSRFLAKLADGEFSFMCDAYLHATQRLLRQKPGLPIKIVVPDPVGISFHEPEAIY